MGDREGLGIHPGILASLVAFSGTVLCEQGPPEGSFGALWGSTSPLVLAQCLGQPRAKSQHSLSSSWPSWCRRLRCLLDEHVLLPALPCSDGQTDAVLRLGRQPKGSDAGVGMPHPPPAFPAGWALARGWGKAGLLGTEAPAVPCSRVLLEVGRQRVAELRGAASGTNHCVSFALQISACKYWCPLWAEKLCGVYTHQTLR